jgi:hypothetical protein
MNSISGRRPARQRAKFDEAKFFTYLREDASSSLRNFLLSIDRRAWIEMSAFVIRYLRRSEEEKLFLERKRRARKSRKTLTTTIRHLEKSKASYLEFASIEIPQIGVLGRPGSLLWPSGTLFFPDVIDAELLKLSGLLVVHKELYNEKRFGVSGNHTWLAMLEEFTAAWTERELGKARKLRAHEIADLITAAKLALGWRENRSETDAEHVRKAIHQYRANPANAKFLSNSIIPYVQNRCIAVTHAPYLLGIEM